MNALTVVAAISAVSEHRRPPDVEESPRLKIVPIPSRFPQPHSSRHSSQTI